ncbi:uncharacterized protein LOC100710708 isoform X1 [Oreochromis niloticus]|uniref:uncharacterized protein LOC100710708 isoform X1 n=1 Tax=Oreochromis niloticus TaxID=8128 RepID=UPI00022B3AC5|nr:uncharacterized protein LOC100710708 isoform X1 [Oreochromis niloticus]
MHRLSHECWIWSPRPSLCLHPQHSGSLLSVMVSHQEEEEEDKETGELPAVCCYSTGCDDVISQSAVAQWSIYEPQVHSGIPSSTGLCQHDVGAPLQQITVVEAEQGDVFQHFMGCQCWGGPGMETQRCVYRQREPDVLGHCSSGSPFIYCGAVRRNVIVGVEVVEEVAVEDTLEVITEDIYADDLLDPDTSQENQPYPT